MIEFELPGGRAAFSTRRGGVSEGPFESLNLGRLVGDEPGHVAENRARLAAATVPQASGLQVHGTAIAEWEVLPPPGEDPTEADGHMTAAPGLGLLVLVADCLPVALIAPGRAAMLHCGWRPLAGGLIEKALALFEEAPAAAIGPGIGPCCYEVGEEVLAEFSDLDGVAEGRMLDLKAVARRKLEAAGVERIDDTGLCTSCNPEEFFSHRRDHGVTGRQGGVAWLSE
ncbi:MAG: laccase domain-containing protein [Thermoleophilaceae bacterium]|nr:laccase domain-containing protein [Thermoleophilaceae bacterium]